MGLEVGAVRQTMWKAEKIQAGSSVAELGWGGAFISAGVPGGRQANG
jgi:hypothetical protein